MTSVHVENRVSPSFVTSHTLNRTLFLNPFLRESRYENKRLQEILLDSTDVSFAFFSSLSFIIIAIMVIEVVM